MKINFANWFMAIGIGTVLSWAAQISVYLTGIPPVYAYTAVILAAFYIAYRVHEKYPIVE